MDCWLSLAYRRHCKGEKRGVQVLDPGLEDSMHEYGAADCLLIYVAHLATEIHDGYRKPCMAGFTKP